ncbi:hypothetical protein ACWX0K_20250 [Nitrobacteraceae bacterium UC4446_H13]
MAKPESEFPTIADLRDRLSELVERGLGDQPVQIVVVPDSTMQAIARTSNDGGKPAIMIEMPGDGNRLPVAFISADRMAGGGMQSTRPQ